MSKFDALQLCLWLAGWLSTLRFRLGFQKSKVTLFTSINNLGIRTQKWTTNLQSTAPEYVLVVFRNPPPPPLSTYIPFNMLLAVIKIILIVHGSNYVTRCSTGLETIIGLSDYFWKDFLLLSVEIRPL